MRIGLVVDHPKRDLSGLVKVAYELARRGVDSILLPQYEQGIEAPLVRLDAILLNNARPQYKSLIAGYRAAGTAVFVLDTEGGVLSESETEYNSPIAMADLFRASGFHRAVTGYFFWGENVCQAYRERSGLPAEAMEVTGCPRYDVCHPDWHGMLDYPREGHVLINTNFSAANPLLLSARGGDRKALSNLGVSDVAIERERRAVEGVSERLMAELMRIIKARPRTTFVLRPHPFEDPTSYRARFQNQENLVVDGTGEVFSVIRDAKALLHVNCSTSVEANCLRTLPISLEYLNDDLLRTLNPLPSRISHSATSPSKLDSILANLDQGAAAFPFDETYDRYIRPWFHVNDGQAAARVVEALLKRLVLSAGGGQLRPAHNLSLGSGRLPPTVQQRAQGLLGNVLGTSTVSRFREAFDAGRKAKRFGCAQVEALLSRLATLQD